MTSHPEFGRRKIVKEEMAGRPAQPAMIVQTAALKSDQGNALAYREQASVPAEAVGESGEAELAENL